MQRENNRSDEALAALAQQGDRTAQEELLGRYQNLVRYCARKFFLSGVETDDLVQEGMMGLFQAIGAYKATENGCSFKNFAYLCISRRIIDAVKASARKKNAPLNDATSIGVVSAEKEIAASFNPEDWLILRDDRRELRQKISGVLSDFEFKVTTMYMDGMTCAEICEATGKPGKSVDNALQRSKKKLQEVLR